MRHHNLRLRVLVPLTLASGLLLAVATAPVPSSAQFDASSVIGETVVIQPKGEYATIDTRVATEAIETLLTGTDEAKADLVAKILGETGRYAPPVLYTFAYVLFHNDLEYQAAFWFHAGQLRARIDANICADESARQAVERLTERFGPDINRYAMQDPATLEALIPQVIEWSRVTPYDYDRRWINLHGMDAAIAGMDSLEAPARPLSLPEDEWDEIAERTRTEYLEAYKKVAAQLKSKDSN